MLQSVSQESICGGCISPAPLVMFFKRVNAISWLSSSFGWVLYTLFPPWLVNPTSPLVFGSYVCLFLCSSIVLRLLWFVQCFCFPTCNPYPLGFGNNTFGPHILWKIILQHSTLDAGGNHIFWTTPRKKRFVNFQLIFLFMLQYVGLKGIGIYWFAQMKGQVIMAQVSGTAGGVAGGSGLLGAEVEAQVSETQVNLQRCLSCGTGGGDFRNETCSSNKVSPEENL